MHTSFNKLHPAGGAHQADNGVKYTSFIQSTPREEILLNQSDNKPERGTKFNLDSQSNLYTIQDSLVKQLHKGDLTQEPTRPVTMFNPHATVTPRKSVVQLKQIYQSR